MTTCVKCHTELPTNAKFCHKCGAKVPASTVPCPNCRFLNPQEAQFCIGCGMNFTKEHHSPETYEAKYPLDFSDTAGLSKSIMGYFIKELRKKVEEEQDVNKYGDYLNFFYDSGFDKTVLTRAEQMAEEAYTIHCKQDGQELQAIDIMLSQNIHSLLDHFIIRYCKELNAYYLPEGILKYEEVRQGSFELHQMIADYLAFEKEEEKVYTDFLSMPMNKLKNASMSFLFPRNDEKILLICDQTVFGSCKEGFALTEEAIYWKAHFEKAQKVTYRELQEIKREHDWITINRHFFNVNPGLNVRMLKLLRKLKEVF